MLRSSYALILVLLGIHMLCIGTAAASTDICHERYRLLDECGAYPPFLAAPAVTQDIEEVSSDKSQDIKEVSRDRSQDIEEVSSDRSQDIEEVSQGSRIEEQLIGAAQGFSKQDEMKELLEKGNRGSAHTQFGSSFGSQATAHRASEMYRAYGLFDLRVTYAY